MHSTGEILVPKNRNFHNITGTGNLRTIYKFLTFSEIDVNHKNQETPSNL